MIKDSSNVTCSPQTCHELALKSARVTKHPRIFRALTFIEYKRYIYIYIYIRDFPPHGKLPTLRTFEIFREKKLENSRIVTLAVKEILCDRSERSNYFLFMQRHSEFWL